MDLNLSQGHLGWTLATLTTKRLLRRRSTWFLLALGLLPSLLAGFWVVARIFDLRSNDTPYGMVLNILSYYFTTFYVPLLSLFLGLGVISDEVETRNITFTMVRPLARTWIALGRLGGHIMVGVCLSAISLAVLFFANLVFQPDEILSSTPFLFNAILVTTLGLIAYLTVIATLGTFWKKFATLAAIFWLIFDNLFARVPVDMLNSLSVMYGMFDSFSEQVPAFGLTFVTLNSGMDFLSLLIRTICYSAAGFALMAVRLKSFEIILTEGGK